MREIYTNHLIRLKDRKKISFSTLQEITGISDSTLCRWFKGEGNPSVDELEQLFEAMGSDMSEVFAEIGKQELIASEKVEYKGADALLADFSRREAIYKENCDQRVAHQIELREKMQNSFDAMISTLSHEHDVALKKRDETYDRTTEYLKKLVESLERKNDSLTERMKDAERRAEVAERIRDDIDKRRHHVFWGMLAALLFIILLFAGLIVFMILVDWPWIGLGWPPTP